jgi:transcription elongation factor Elf1
MPQVQMKLSYIPMTISCDHCLQEQIVHMQAKTGFWQMAHQSVKCVRCEKYFEVMIPDAIVAGPFLPLNVSSEK